MSADGRVAVTVPGPDVTRAISWEDVRAYLRWIAWAKVHEATKDDRSEDLGGTVELWVADPEEEKTQRYVMLRPGEVHPAYRMRLVVEKLARVEGRGAAAVLADIARGDVPATSAEIAEIQARITALLADNDRLRAEHAILLATAAEAVVAVDALTEAAASRSQAERLRQAAEDMRERAAKEADFFGSMGESGAIARRIRALPFP